MRRHALGILIVASLGLSTVGSVTLLTACAPKSIDSYHTAENEEEIVRLLNQREYSKAIWLVESRNGKNPEDANIGFLLGQAYLGKAGFEPLAVAAKVSEGQNFSSREGRLLFPSCPAGRLTSVSDSDLLCLLKRVYLNTPDADLEEMNRARNLFRRAYPDPASAPEWVNVLIGTVETASCVKRVGGIYVMVRRVQEEGFVPGNEDLGYVVRQAKRALEEASQALSRADHSGNKISQLLTGNRNSSWFEGARGAVHWADRLGFVTFFDLLRLNSVGPEEESQYGDVLNKIRALLDEQEKRMEAGH